MSPLVVCSFNRESQLQWHRWSDNTEVRTFESLGIEMEDSITDTDEEHDGDPEHSNYEADVPEVQIPHGVHGEVSVAFDVRQQL